MNPVRHTVVVAASGQNEGKSSIQYITTVLKFRLAGYGANYCRR